MDCFAARADDSTTTLIAVEEAAYAGWLDGQDDRIKAWLSATGFKGKPGGTSLLPGADGSVQNALLVIENADDLWSWGGAPGKLPEGSYAIDPAVTDAKTLTRACLGWALGSYVFDRYRKREEPARRLVWPKTVNQTEVTAIASGVYLTRDLINTPASDMGPGELASAAAALARDFGGACETVVGDDLLRENFPMIHAVGRASSRPPRLIDLAWGKSTHPKLTLVGKGVCFDSGGLDLKPSSAMLMMKKDMGGAAQVLGLARMIMALTLPVRLRVLIPAVENSVSGDSFRPLDILSSRKGLTVEIGNTDAEGRLVLADALTLACEEDPDLLIDFATLTGAARVALGTDLPALFTNSDSLAADLAASGSSAQDPTWRLPLHKPYAKMLDSKIADTNNVSSGGYAGAITAALFLEKFITPDTEWAHIDLMSWNVSGKPGRPEGGEAQAVRGVLDALRKRYE
ncbi:leucyl aminopeptidase family protein [Rhodospirillaceae bacterium KN72]|uniref:Leucyl aminopeptidase family protein n=1 Tax=Pacificispira spongiicola TaxID=2729598 RepID=A0A7Y0E252_9PROT|nr:leucyl aminopeptidase family protein [Pacificispira spongiicola]NMM45838.1 leucyl aminopeptidase family protein [Pacificispira spongiicola]